MELSEAPKDYAAPRLRTTGLSQQLNRQIVPLLLQYKCSLSVRHKLTLAVPNYFSQILVTFKIKNLATHNCAKDWGKVVPAGLGMGKPTTGLG